MKAPQPQIFSPTINNMVALWTNTCECMKVLAGAQIVSSVNRNGTEKALKEVKKFTLLIAGEFELYNKQFPEKRQLKEFLTNILSPLSSIITSLVFLFQEELPTGELWETWNKGSIELIPDLLPKFESIAEFSKITPLSTLDKLEPFQGYHFIELFTDVNVPIDKTNIPLILSAQFFMDTVIHKGAKSPFAIDITDGWSLKLITAANKITVRKIKTPFQPANVR